VGFDKVPLTLCLFLGSWACAEEPSFFAARAVEAVQAKGLVGLEPFLDDNSAVLLRRLPQDLLEAPVPGAPPVHQCRMDEPSPNNQVLVTCGSGTREVSLVVEEGPQGLRLNLFAPVFSPGSGLPADSEEGDQP
jgi:hypothetical protein